MLKIVEIDQSNKQEIEEFLKLPKASLLQSFNWAKFQENLARKTWSFKILNENNILASALFTKYDLPLGKSYLFCSRGPVVGKLNNDLKAEVLKLIIKKIKEIAEQENSIFFRLDPEWSSEEDEELLNKLKFKKSKKEVNPKNTLILDIS